MNKTAKFWIGISIAILIGLMVFQMLELERFSGNQGSGFSFGVGIGPLEILLLTLIVSGLIWFASSLIRKIRRR